MRNLSLVVLLAVAACSTHDVVTPGDPNAVDGTWTGSTPDYATVRAQLTEDPSDHSIAGTWTGSRAGSAIVDNGIVIGGSRRTDATVDLGLTALNAPRALHIAGTTTGGNRITGTAFVLENGVHGPTRDITLTRQ